MHRIYSSLVSLYWLLYVSLCSITPAHLCSLICLRQWLCYTLVRFIDSLVVCCSTHIHHKEGVPLHGNMTTVRYSDDNTAHLIDTFEHS